MNPSPLYPNHQPRDRGCFGRAAVAMGPNAQIERRGEASGTSGAQTPIFRAHLWQKVHESIVMVWADTLFLSRSMYFNP